MQSLRVMLVDDDMLAVDDLKDFIDWQRYGFEVAGMAYNGKQALKLLTQVSPHLIISDISMPLMDGIRLADEVARVSPDTHVILLTAYNDFEYVRSAMHANVDDYIIKDELNEETLGACLEKVRRRIEVERTMSSRVFQCALSDWFSEGEAYVNEHYDERTRAFFAREHYAILLFRERPVLGAEREWTRSSEARAQQELMRLLGAELRESRKIFSMSTILAVTWENDMKSYRYFRENGGIESLCACLRRKMAEGVGCRVSAAYTSVPMPFAQIARRLVGPEGGPLRMEMFLAGSESVLPLGDERPMVASEPELSDKLISEMLRREGKERHAFLRALICPKPDARIGWQNCLRVLRYLDDRLQRHLGSPWTGAPCYDLEGCARYLDGLCLAYGESRESGRAQRAEVKQAIAYLQEHFADSKLRVEQVARFIGISSSRLSVIFKEDMGATINQYLTQLRIEEAKRLLREGGDKLYEIAARVGYDNSQYFSTVFFKETGMYPSQYRHSEVE